MLQVNAVDYYHGGDKPYLISGADDRLIKIWDYQNKACVATLDGHAHNVSAVCFHPELPIIITGSEDSTVRIWHANTNRQVFQLIFSLAFYLIIWYQLITITVLWPMIKIPIMLFTFWKHWWKTSLLWGHIFFLYSDNLI